MILDSDTCIYIYHVLFDVNYRYNEMQTFSEHEYFMCGKTYIQGFLALKNFESLQTFDNL